MKTNGAKHGTLKELFFPSTERDASSLPDRVARFTSVFWVAHILCSEINKHWKAVNFALKHDKKMPAPFFFSQVEKDARKQDKDAKLKAARAQHLQDTKADHEREAEQAVKNAAAKRKRTERAEV